MGSGQEWGGRPAGPLRKETAPARKMPPLRGAGGPGTPRGPRTGVLFGAVPPTCFHACRTLSPSQPTAPQMPRPGPTPTREPSLAPSCPPLPPASLGPLQDTPSQLRPNIPGSPGRSARSLGELPQPNCSHSVGPQICSHAPSAGTTRSLKPTGLSLVYFSDRAHAGSPRAVTEGPQPPASDRSEQSTAERNHSRLPLRAVCAETTDVEDPRPKWGSLPRKPQTPDPGGAACRADPRS